MIKWNEVRNHRLAPGTLIAVRLRGGDIAQQDFHAATLVGRVWRANSGALFVGPSQLAGWHQFIVINKPWTWFKKEAVK